MFRCILLAIALAIAVFTLLPADSDGCAPVGRPGDYIRIAEESAIIVWDPVKKIEHFIRSAAFDTKSPDFGFLVPTPSVPKLEEVEGAIFDRMRDWLRPIVVQERRIRTDPFFCCFTGMSPDKNAAMAPGGVRVLGEQKVGGFDTAILEADNTEDLSKWLKDNGYSSDPELQSWLVPYVGAKWKITAFKISQDPKTGQLATTKPVRMSFAAERPFFPYREPERKGEKQQHEPRLLRVFFISDTRVDGKLGDVKWHANVRWADKLSAEQRQQIAKETGVADDQIPANAWMTAFEDSASPRPGKVEVYFDPAQDQTPIRPTVTHYNYIWIPIDVAVLGAIILLAVGGLVVRKMMRARKAAEST